MIRHENPAEINENDGGLPPNQIYNSIFLNFGTNRCITIQATR